MASLKDALMNVDCLKEVALPDEQPIIEPEPASIVYEVSFDTNFADRTAFITGIGRYNEEATICSNLNVILEQGEEYAGMLYTWRSLSRAVPAIKAHDQSNRLEIYEKTVEVLGPEVAKARELMRFLNQASARFCDEIRQLAHPERRKDFISETYLLTLAKLVNMFATLDLLKNMKACINNDLACYKRAEGILNRGNVDAFALEESQNLSIFFATNNSITNELKKHLEEVSGYEDVLVETINLCCLYYEEQQFVLPKEKYILLKAIGYGLVLLDGNVVNINKLKKFNITRVDRLFKLLPVAPLYGDVQIRFADWVKQLAHFDPSKWTCTSEQQEEKATVAIQNRVEIIRSEHVRFISELARYNNEIITKKQFELNDQTAKELTEMAQQGIKLLTSWTTAIMELYSWKLLHPTNEYDNKECPKDAEAYERATRYNYNSEEKYALIEVIGMIKGLSLLMHRMELHFSEAIRHHTYLLIQEFVQVTLRDSIRASVKKKKQQAKAILLGIRDVCVDWLDGKEKSDDPALRGEKDPKIGYNIKLPRRCIRLSSTQLYMMRTMLESLISEKSGSKKSLRNDLHQSSIPDFEIFHRNTYFFTHLLNFDITMRECCDLSQLWFREFYLELTMGQRIQFPIEMSLPWILTSHILQNKEARMMEYIFYPLDLYSDSAHYALHHFKKQFLYGEIEAEVNLCFDQLVYQLSEQIFFYYKQLAASIYLDKRFRADCAPNKFPHPSPNRYETILKQRHVQLLGRSIDLNNLLAQRLGSNMLKAIDTALHVFESKNICGVVELLHLLEINRLTHEMLSKYVVLDSFEAMYREINQSVVSPHGRVTLHIFWELIYDFIPNYCYNSTSDRFVLSELPQEGAEREAPPKGTTVTNILFGNKQLREAYQSIFTLYDGFVGSIHFQALSKLLGYHGIAMLLEQLLNVIHSNIIQTQLKPYVEALTEGMPQKCKLPFYQYGSKGVLGFYLAQLAPVIQYKDLRTDVFQAFKELGNSVIFALLLEKALGQQEVVDILQAAPFQNMYPRPYVKDDQNMETVMKQLDQQYAPLNLVAMISRHGTENQATNARDAELLTRERLCRALSMFEVVMQRIKSFLISDKIWQGDPPANGVMSIDECQEFHRLWSAIQFAYCLPLAKNEISIEQCFGEGLQWAGCVIMVLLGQDKRFSALDFCYHMLRVHEVDNQDGVVQGIDLKQMIRRVKVFKNLNNQIFVILNKHLSSSDIIQRPIREYQPPIFQSTQA